MLLPLDLLAAHMMGDYILQSHFMAANKLTNWRVRLLHVSAYSIPFFLVGLWHLLGMDAMLRPHIEAMPVNVRLLWFMALLFVMHFATDSKRFRTSNPWTPLPILIDQSLHIAQIAILARLLV